MSGIADYDTKLKKVKKCDDVELSPSKVRINIEPKSSHSPATPQSGRARAKTLLLDRSLESLETVAIPSWIIFVVMALVLSKFVELSTSEVRLNFEPLSSHSPAMPQSGRARAKTLVLDRSLQSVAPVAIPAWISFVVMALELSQCWLLSML